MTDIFNEDTIIAPATIPGTGAISLLRISGPDTFRLVDSIVRFRNGDASSCPGGRVKFGSIFQSDGSLLDEVLVNIYRAPHSYTGEDCCEIMCHASPYIVNTILNLATGKTDEDTVSRQACRLAEPGEFTRRAFINGKMDLSQAEAVADVISSSDSASHRIALNQLKGGFSEELGKLRAALLKMTSLMELELDFSEEDVEFADRTQLRALLDTTLEKVDSLASSFRLGNAIKNGVPVAIVGDANAGKSTLLNRLIGEQRAIVSDIAGTTRDTVEECLNIDGVLFRFIDTAGIRETEGEIERIGIERSFESIKKADIVIILLDTVTLSKTLDNTTSVSPSVDSAIKQILDACDVRVQKLIFALNKCDVSGIFVDNIFVNSKNTIVPYIDNQGVGIVNGAIQPDFIKISAKEGTGINELKEILSSYEKNAIDKASSASVLVTNARHYSALVTAREDLLRVKSGLASSSPTDIVAEDLRSALSTLGSITGEITTNEVLGEIFGKFCIGK